MGDEGVGFRDQHLGQHSAGAFTGKFGQWIVDRFRLTERNDSGISRHGVSLLSGGSGRLDTRLDTPPSINRRHPDSRLARAISVATLGRPPEQYAWSANAISVATLGRPPRKVRLECHLGGDLGQTAQNSTPTVLGRLS